MSELDSQTLSIQAAAELAQGDAIRHSMRETLMTVESCYMRAQVLASLAILEQLRAAK